MSAGGRRRVAVIPGAGPAGLTAAKELSARTGVLPIVFERTHATGGITQTHEYKGNRIDLGGHRFFSNRDRAMLQRPRLSSIYWRKNLFPYPLGITPTAALRLGLANTALITRSYRKAQLFPRRDETYLDAFFINRFGIDRDVMNAKGVLDRFAAKPRAFPAAVAALPKRPNIAFVRCAKRRSVHISLVANRGLLDGVSGRIVHDRSEDNRRLISTAPARTGYLFDKAVGESGERSR